MLTNEQELQYFRERAEREIALVKSTGANAYASADYKTVFITRRDGSEEKLRVPPPGEKPH